jgi:MFS family permease
MMTHLGVSEKEIGVNAGLVASCAMFGAVLSFYALGRLSDAFGRKPLLVFGALVTVLGARMRGFVERVWLVVLIRLVAGMSNSSLVVTKAYISDITTPRQVARAFSTYAGLIYIAIVLAPVLGGMLAQPCEPDAALHGLFHDDSAFCRHPFLLLCLASVLINVGVLIAVWVFLPESNTAHARKYPWLAAFATPRCGLCCNQARNTASYNDIELDDRSSSVTTAESAPVDVTAPAVVPSATGSVPFYRDSGVLLLCLSYFCVAAADVGFFELLPVFCEASLAHGGLDMTSLQIGILQGIPTVLLAVYLIFVHPRITARRSPAWLYRTGALGSMCALCMPVLQHLGVVAQHSGVAHAALWTLLVLTVLFKMLFSEWCYMIIIPAIATYKSGSAGEMTGLTTTVAQFARGLTPLLLGSLWTATFTVPLHQYFVYACVGVICLVIYYVGTHVSFRETCGKEDDAAEEQEEAERSRQKRSELINMNLVTTPSSDLLHHNTSHGSGGGGGGTSDEYCATTTEVQYTL